MNRRGLFGLFAGAGAAAAVPVAVKADEKTCQHYWIAAWGQRDPRRDGQYEFINGTYSWPRPICRDCGFDPWLKNGHYKGKV